MISLDELKKVSANFNAELDKINQSIDIDKTEKKLKNLEELTIQPDFWSDNDKAQNIIAEINELKDLINDYNRLIDIYETIDEY